jgi:tryptophan-rich sensory protein
MTPRSTAQTWLGLLAWILIAFIPSATAAFVDTGPRYDTLNRPAWTPPSWVFGPVWTTLYLLMGIAAWRVWLPHGFTDRAARRALVLFLVHLILNAAWTWLFFGLHMLAAAAVEIVVLWAMILALVAMFWRRDRLAGALLMPYLVWVTYAATLSIGFAMMNPANAPSTEEESIP